MCALLDPLTGPPRSPIMSLHRDLRQRRRRQVFRNYFVVHPGSTASFLTHSLVLSKMKTARAMSHFFLKVNWLTGTFFGRINGNDRLRDLGGSIAGRTCNLEI